MLTHPHTESAEPKPSEPHGSPMPPPQENIFPAGPSDTRAESPEPVPENSLFTPKQPATELKPARAAGTQVNGTSSFGLEDIRAVAFRCGVCRTVVRLPRIRWASSPEACPNCGAGWMRQPSDQISSPEDNANYVFRIVRAFRESLQALAAMEQSAPFTLRLETGPESSWGAVSRKPAKAKGQVLQMKD